MIEIKKTGTMIKMEEKSSENGYYSFRNAEKKFIYSILEKDKNILTNMKGRR